MCARALIFGFIWQDGFNVLVLCVTPSLKLVGAQVLPSRGSLNLWVPRGGGHPKLQIAAAFFSSSVQKMGEIVS